VIKGREGRFHRKKEERGEKDKEEKRRRKKEERGEKDKR
jgi:hypothetical protein